MILLYKNIIRVMAGLFLTFLVLNVFQSARSQEITGLSGWTLFIDPGHSQKENMGLYGYSEAEKVLRVGLALRGMLLDQTDIEAVYMARLTDQDNISLAGRTDLANTLGADFYYSIHSDAGAPASNSTLMLYGGWKSNGVLVEKTPVGGGAYGAILDQDLTGAMRIGKRGNYADRIFYLGDVPHHENQFSYLHVNRASTMTSLLSEAGFHTNPEQQMRNINAEWKVLEALSAYRSFLEWHGINRPAIGVATGIIKDVETGLPLNDVNVTIGEKVYTTDGYESIFKNYSTNPETLRNGFYYIPGLEPLSNVEVKFEKQGFQTLTQNLTIVSNPNGRTAENLSFLDPLMVSLTPATVVSVEPSTELDNLIPGKGLRIHFSRKMNRESTQNAISFDPAAVVEYEWLNDFVLEIKTGQLSFLTNYTLTIDGAIAKNSLTDQFLDGDGNGTEGGNFTIQFTTSDEDTDAPVLVDFSPSENTPVRTLRPIIRLVYDEVIIAESIAVNAMILKASNSETAVAGVIDHKVVNGQSVMHFFPTEDLTPGVVYTITIAAGLSDMFDNTTEEQQIRFFVINQPLTLSTVIDNFNSGLTGWWNPQQAGQTLGVVTELTSRTHNLETVNRAIGSTGSMKLSYGWDMDYVGTPYIRQHIPATASQNGIRFNRDNILQVYIFGDGSGNRVRMMIRDGLNQLETHNWVNLDWFGWKLVSWDLANDPAFGWAGVGGNGILEGANFYMDGFHLQYVEGAKVSGSIYFDHLHFVKRGETGYPTTLFENWQDFDDFTSDLFPWITVDVKDDITYNPAGFTFPGSGEPFAFKVMNPTATTPSIIDNHPAVDGDKYLIAMQSQTINEDKWLISPQLRATSLSQLSFYAKSIEVATYGPERMQVYISFDNAETFVFDPDNFSLLSEGEYIEVPAQWTSYRYFLGTLVGKVYRFAIRYVSDDDYMLILDKIEVKDAPTYTLSITTLPENVGNITGAGEYAEDQQATVQATPAAGYVFKHWADADGNILSTSGLYTFAMPASNLAIVAHFAAASYNLVLKIQPEGTGTVTGGGSYPANTAVTAEATPAEGYRFVNWTNRDVEEISTDASYNFMMPARNFELTANFEPALNVMSDLNTDGLQIYPNPVSSALSIKFDGEIESVQITDMAGRKAMIITQNLKTMDVSHLEQGFYILRIESGKQTFYRKIQIIK
jgi:N-acetylmuramoyl-L-alanine amidase